MASLAGLPNMLAVGWVAEEPRKQAGHPLQILLSAIAVLEGHGLFSTADFADTSGRLIPT